jgi:hypothetical protein
MSVKLKSRTKAKSRAGEPKAFQAIGFVWPDFDSPEAMNEWLNSFPHEEAEVDPRLKQRFPVELNLHELMIEGFEFLAGKQGLKSGKELMYVVLSQYLSANLPEDF